MQERRKHTRYNIEADVLISHKEGLSAHDMTTRKAAIKDISLGGARIHIFAETPYPLSTDVMVQVPLPDGVTTFVGTIVYVIEVTENKQFDIGIQFSYISELDMKRLQYYIENLSKQDI
ncbi:MAG: PilZ domain-containing protein [Nitrospirota bacterium]|nr:PilZ domain-containing protein [Nitrospirota bacterium]